MSQEREKVRLSGVSTKEEEKPLKEMSKSEKKARFARILERGIINSRLDVEVPKGIHLEWVRKDEIEITRMKSLGFTVDTEYAKATALHSDGSDVSIVGDVIAMICPQEHYDIIREIKHERFMEMHSPKEAQLEESDYQAKVKAQTPEVPIIDESRAREATKEEISSVLKSR